jgi:hypothetical protein
MKAINRFVSLHGKSNNRKCVIAFITTVDENNSEFGLAQNKEERGRWK